MPYLASLPDNAGPPNLFKRYPEIYHAWAEMSQAMMNGPSELSRGERELILAFAAGAAGCEFVCSAHAEVAYQLGVERGLIEAMLQDFTSANLSDRLRPLMFYVKQLSMAPASVNQAMVTAVLAAGWSEDVVHTAAVITARAAFMQRLVQGFGFHPLAPDVVKEHAAKRVQNGYVNLYRVFRKDSKSSW